jgi:hypothetical protein
VYAGAAPIGIAAPVTISASGGGVSELFVNGGLSSSPATVHLDGAQIGSVAGDNLFAPGGALSYSCIPTVTLNAPNASSGDSIFVTPAASTSFSINAGSPSSAPGDALTIAPNGATNPVFTPNGTSGGQYLFNNRQPITFTGVENLVYDNVPPAVMAASSSQDTLPLSVTLSFNKNVSAGLPSMLTAANLTTGGSASLSRVTTPSGTSATYTSAASLPDGNYRITLPAGSIVDSSGNALTSDYTYDFFVLAGDANHDRHVDEADLAILDAHLGQAGGGSFSQGNFNYDNAIDAADTAILNANLHVWLPPQGALSLPINTFGGDNTYRLKLESSGGSMLDVYTTANPTPGDSPLYRIPTGALSGLTFGGNAAGNDTLAIDLSSGYPFVPGGVTFTGGTGGNTLRFIGSAADDRVDIDANSAAFHLNSAPSPVKNLFWTSGPTIQFPGGSGGSDTLNILSGTYAVDADTPSGAPNITVALGSQPPGLPARVDFASPQRLAGLSIGAGAAAHMPSTEPRGLLSAGALSIAEGGLLDLGAADLLTTTPAASIRGYLQSAYGADGDWSGQSGITSAIAAANPVKYTVGWADGSDPSAQDAGIVVAGNSLSPGQVLVRPTLTGDANLDGRVDFFDITQVLGYKYNTSQAASYTDGDLDYSGQTNFFDLATLLSANYNSGQSFSPATAAEVADSAAVAAALPPTPGTTATVEPPPSRQRRWWDNDV